MSFTYLKMNIKHLLRQKEFFFTLLFTVCLVIGFLLIDLFSFIGSHAFYRNPAWFYWGTAGMQASSMYGSMDMVAHVLEMLLLILLPFVAALAFSYCHFDNVQSGVIKTLIHRVGAGAYYRTNAVTVFFAGFLVIFLPLVLEQLVLCIAFPLQTPMNIATWPVVDDYTKALLIPDQFAFLQMNYPYLYNFLLCLVPSVTAGIFAFCSYTLSLYFHRSRFLVLTLPGMVLWLIPQFGLTSIQRFEEFASRVLKLGPSTDFVLWGIVLGALLILNILLTEIKIHLVKDVV